MEIEKLEPEEITIEWVKENLCMDDGTDITDCYSKLIVYTLRYWEDFEFNNIKDVLPPFHVMIKNKKITWK